MEETLNKMKAIHAVRINENKKLQELYGTDNIGMNMNKTFENYKMYVEKFNGYLHDNISED